MKTTIFSSLAVGAMVALFACQGPSNNDTNTNRDTVGAINSAPENTTGTDRTGTTADSAKAAQGTVDDKTHEFMKDAAMGGMAEVEIAKLAKDRALSPRVKKFAEMMITDHSAANNDLKAIARQKSVTLPENLGKHEDHLKDLSSKNGNDFDKAYMKMMVNDHKDDVDDFEDIAKNGTDPDVKTFASQKLPTLRKHLDSAKAIQQSLK